MLKTVRLIRKLHLDTIIIVDAYEYYYVYDNDVFAIYYLLNFTIKKDRNSFFMRNKIEYLNYLVSKLKENKINCIVVVKRNGYNVILKMDFDDNNYIFYTSKGKIVYKRKKEIKFIKNKLKSSIIENEEKIYKIKEVIKKNE